MHQLLVWTFWLTTGAMVLAMASGQFVSTSLALVVLALIVWHIKRQRDEGQKL